MEFKKRKMNRLKGFDYSTNGAYFVTICTKDRKCTLSKIVGMGNPSPTLGNIIGWLKYNITKEYDHIIRNERDYLEILQYIENNPLKWELDELYSV